MILQIVLLSTIANILFNFVHYLTMKKMFRDLNVQIIANYIRQEESTKTLENVEKDLNYRLRELQTASFAPQVRPYIKLVNKESE